MTTRFNDTDDIINTVREVLRLVEASPPHVRPWLRGIEAAASSVTVEVGAANRRAAGRFLTWLEAGLAEEAQDDCRG